MTNQNKQMNIVIVGHVDHGKSTFIGRLLADTGSLPDGKLEQVKRTCERNAKPFEYAFLLDALKDEQAQGITIDTARCFFKTKKRHYIIIDAPGHIEFLKNMITGAARAQAALLLIDAKEGVQENSRRHGFMASLLGIRQLVVLVNKMDLVNYDQATFNRIESEYRAFLKEINVAPITFIPIAAREGDNLVNHSANMPWYSGAPVLDVIDTFETEKEKYDQAFRFPVQDIYKFTEEEDDRRIVAGTIETGRVSVGDEVIFLPSKKKSVIQSIEGFNEAEKTTTDAGHATGFTLNTQIYIKPGELMCKTSEPIPHTGSTFKANLFWLGKHPFVKDKKYKLKLATSRVAVYLKDIISVLDASDLSTENHKRQVDRHDVAECILQTLKPIAYDLSSEIESTGRFVIIDDYEIAGGGIITQEVDDKGKLVDDIEKRDFAWVRSNLTPQDRAAKFRHKSKFILITGKKDTGKMEIAKALEADLFSSGYAAYYLGISNILAGFGSDIEKFQDREEHIRRLGETAHLFTEAGMLFISTISDLDEDDIAELRLLNQPNDVLIIHIGPNESEIPVDGSIDRPESIDHIVMSVKEMLIKKEIFLEYYL